MVARTRAYQGPVSRGHPSQDDGHGQTDHGNPWESWTLKDHPQSCGFKLVVLGTLNNSGVPVGIVWWSLEIPGTPWIRLKHPCSVRVCTSFFDFNVFSGCSKVITAAISAIGLARPPNYTTLPKSSGFS